MKKLKYIMEFQDSFASKFQLSIKGKESYHSYITIILSFIVNFSTIYLFLVLAIQLMNHSQPSINYQKRTLKMSENITMNTEDLIFLISLKGKTFNLINDPTIAYLEAIYEVTSAENGMYNKYNYKLDSMNCSNIENFFINKNLKKIFDSSGLIDYSCFNWKKGNIIVGGHFGSEFYGDVAFFIKKCVNTTENKNHCKSNEIINEALQAGYVEITYIGAFADYYNYTYPIQFNSEDFFSQIDTSFNKILYLYFNSLYFYSGNNIIFTNRKMEKATKFEKVNSDIIRIVESQGIVCSVYIVPSLTSEEYYRSYTKIQDLGASVSGLRATMGFIVLVLNAYFRKKEINLFIADNLFTLIEDNYGKKLKKKQKINKNINIICNNINNIKSLPSFNLNINNNDHNKINNINHFENRNEIRKHYSKTICDIFDNKIGKNKHKSSELKISSFDFSQKNNSKRIMSQMQHKKLKNNIIIINVKYALCKFLNLLFCPCLEKSNIFKNQYKTLAKELIKYTDFIEIAKHLMDIHKIKVILIESGLSRNWISEKKILYLNSNKSIIEDFHNSFIHDILNQNKKNTSLNYDRHDNNLLNKKNFSSSINNLIGDNNQNISPINAIHLFNNNNEY